MLWFHKPYHPTQHEQLYLHGRQQEIPGLSLHENLVYVGSFSQILHKSLVQILLYCVQRRENQLMHWGWGEKVVLILSFWGLESLGWCLQKPPPGTSPLPVSSHWRELWHLKYISASQETVLVVPTKDFLHIFCLLHFRKLWIILNRYCQSH